MRTILSSIIIFILTRFFIFYESSAPKYDDVILKGVRVYDEQLSVGSFVFSLFIIKLQWMPVIRTSSGTAFNVLIAGINYIGYVSTVFE